MCPYRTGVVQIDDVIGGHVVGYIYLARAFMCVSPPREAAEAAAATAAMRWVPGEEERRALW